MGAIKNKRPLSALLFVVILTGCGNIMTLALEYADSKPVMVPVKIERSYITGVGVQFHPDDPHRAYVVARAGVADEGWLQWKYQLDRSHR